MLKNFSIYEREKNRKNSVVERRKSRLSVMNINNNNANQKSAVINQDMMNSLISLGNFCFFLNKKNSTFLKCNEQENKNLLLKKVYLF